MVRPLMYQRWLARQCETLSRAVRQVMSTSFRHELSAWEQFCRSMEWNSRPRSKSSRSFGSISVTGLAPPAGSLGSSLPARPVAEPHLPCGCDPRFASPSRPLRPSFARQFAEQSLRHLLGRTTAQLICLASVLRSNVHLAINEFK
jgi:hypothetical protein